VPLFGIRRTPLFGNDYFFDEILIKWIEFNISFVTTDSGSVRFDLLRPTVKVTCAPKPCTAL
jgi:hypothetical protein